MQTSAGRFSANSFQYNGRVALAFIPSLFVLAAVAGGFVVGTMMVGAMVTYMMDMMRWKEASFGSTWLTLVVSNLGFLIGGGLPKDGPVILSLGMIGIVGATLMTTGIWATVQFKWIQLKHPAVVIALERLLLVACLPVGLVVQTWGVVSAVGVGNAPFFMMAMGCVLYFLCMVPLPSSFQTRRPSSIGGRMQGASQIQGRGDGMVASLTIILLPGLTYFAGHYGVIFEYEHFWSLALLWSLPLLFICGLPGGLWWVSDRPEGQRAFRIIFTLISGMVAIAGFEFRVIFQSFSQYIPLTPPWSWMAVAVCLYVHAAVVGAHFAGLLEGQAGFIVGGGAMIMSAGVGGAIVGLPLPLMPCPLIGAAGAALYYDSHQLRDYLVFLAGTLTSISYLVYQHFWFLDISVGGMSVQSICQVAIVAMVVAFVVPGLLLSGVNDNFVKIGLEAFLLIQGLAMCVLEERLYAGDHDEDDVIYPAYLVLATSVIGICMARRLETHHFITEMSAYLLQCMYVAKLPMILLPQANLVVPTFSIALAVSPPYLLMKSEQGRQQERLQPWQGLVLMLAIFSSVVLSRFAIFDLIQSFLAPHPSEGLLFGVLLIAIAAGCFPLVSRCYPNSQTARRSLILVLSLGVLMCILRPPFPIAGGAECPKLPFEFCPRLWDERHIPSHETDDVSMYGLGLARREHWPLWMILLALIMALAAATSGVPVQQSVNTRLGYAAIGGLSAGAYLALEFFPGQPPLQILVLMAMVLVCGFLVLLQRPAVQAWGSLMSVLATVWGLLLPITLLMQSVVQLPDLPVDMQRLYPDRMHSEVDTERRQAGRAAVLAIYAAQALLMSFSLKLKVSSAMRSTGPSLPQTRITPSSVSWRSLCGPAGFSILFSSMVPPQVMDRVSRLTRMDGAGAMMLQRLSVEGLGWAPTAGNVMAIMSFSMCMILNQHFTGGSSEGAIMLVPILLLLNQDPVLLRSFAERQRYLPPVIVLLGYLWGVSLYSIIQIGIVHPNIYLSKEESGVTYTLKNLGLLFLTLPNHISFVERLWNQKSSSLLLLITPLNTLPLCFASLDSVTYLSLVGLVGAIFEFFSARHIKKLGMRLI